MQNVIMGTVLMVLALASFFWGMLDDHKEKEKTGTGNILSGVIKVYYGILGMALSLPVFLGLVKNVYIALLIIFYIIGLYKVDYKMTK